MFNLIFKTYFINQSFIRFTKNKNNISALFLMRVYSICLLFKIWYIRISVTWIFIFIFDFYYLLSEYYRWNRTEWTISLTLIPGIDDVVESDGVFCLKLWAIDTSNESKYNIRHSVRSLIQIIIGVHARLQMLSLTR